MTHPNQESLVTVYSSPLAFDASIVKAMLQDNEIPAFVEDSHAPFAGLSTSPCHVMVEQQHEIQARRYIEEHEAKRKESVDRAYDEEIASENSIEEGPLTP